MPPMLEAKVGVLTKVRSKFGKPLGFHVVKLLLIHEILKHSPAFNRGETIFDQKGKVRVFPLMLRL